MATFDHVRRIALALPEVQEKPHFGMPAFRSPTRASSLWPRTTHACCYTST
jgi:hypothetical protein